MIALASTPPFGDRRTQGAVSGADLLDHRLIRDGVARGHGHFRVDVHIVAIVSHPGRMIDLRREDAIERRIFSARQVRGLRAAQRQGSPALHNRSRTLLEGHGCTLVARSVHVCNVVRSDLLTELNAVKGQREQSLGSLKPLHPHPSHTPSFRHRKTSGLEPTTKSELFNKNKKSFKAEWLRVAGSP